MSFFHLIKIVLDFTFSICLFSQNQSLSIFLPNRLLNFLNPIINYLLSMLKEK